VRGPTPEEQERAFEYEMKCAGWQRIDTGGGCTGWSHGNFLLTDGDAACPVSLDQDHCVLTLHDDSGGDLGAFSEVTPRLAVELVHNFV
jgi:hypothetical protein